MNYILYGKTATDKTYKSVDITNGTFVRNLMYASLVPEENLDKLKAMADVNVKYGVASQIRIAGTNKIVYKTK
jgi:hypothetical protein